MIRINLLGRARPKAPRQAVPLEATLQVVFFMAALLVAFGVLYYNWHSTNQQITEVRLHIQKQTGEKARLIQLKAQVDEFERQKAVLQQRINVIEELQRNRTGGQELLDALANTVTRTDTLWLTSFTRSGNGLTIIGTAGSINAVANFITQLEHSGYFNQIEIKDSTQDTKNTAVQTFTFTLTAQFALPQDKAADSTASAAPAPTRKG
ncbi:MAG TPA: PilN domain-containing protein [Candidatus Acidoferrales bacterium]|jgi:Tfp pilus assembly protein PilN|nr:PilN domain-containing protein [Candidatus Acidoferrales bacterium]